MAETDKKTDIIPPIEEWDLDPEFIRYFGIVGHSRKLIRGVTPPI